MPRRSKEDVEDLGRPRPVAETPLQRERELIGLANDLAEQQLRDGTASAAVIGHYLKAGSSREVLEQDRLRFENELTQVKRQAMLAQAEQEVKFEQVIRAMGIYSGKEPVQDEMPEGYEEPY